jgi:hypothetical protein
VTKELVRLMDPMTEIEVGSLPIAKQKLISLCSSLGRTSRSGDDGLFIFCIMYVCIYLFVYVLLNYIASD